MTAVAFSSLDLAFAAILVLCAAGLSNLLQLGIGRRLLWASLRLIAQLTLVGLVLRRLFESNSLALGLGLVALMIAAAIYETATRPAARLQAGFNIVAAAAGIGASVLLIVGLAASVLGHEQDVASPRVLVPIAGIVLGTAMNAASLALNTFLRGLQRERLGIEAMIALGRGRFETLAPLGREAVANGIIPTLNQMAGAGIITLPGLMSGQVLAGADPLQAAWTQVFLSLLLCVAALLSCAGVILVLARRVTDNRGRLRLERLIPSDAPKAKKL